MDEVSNQVYYYEDEQQKVEEEETGSFPAPVVGEPTVLVSSHTEDDYLSGSELAKIECFYSSMGCYVYVARCIAELYQIKREDEFDAIDSDPVDDYREFMKRKQEQQQRNEFAMNKVNKLFGAGAADSSDTESGSIVNHVKSDPINYMYINSGVPVIVFNYGANPKRNKDLRIILAERATGFCLWEFKFDRLTQFENADEMTVIRLTLNHPGAAQNNNNNNISQSLLSPPPTTSSTTNSSSSSSNHHSFFSSVFHHHNHNSNNNNNLASSQYPPIAYHNEYFERFFNAAKNPRGMHKEHLIKFVIKRDCDEFCYKLARIMNDKRNSDLFRSNDPSELRGGKNAFYQSNQSLNSINSSVSNQQPPGLNANTSQTGPAAVAQSKSSVIICHFDFFNYEFNLDAHSLAASFTRKEKTPSLPDYSRTHLTPFPTTNHQTPSLYSYSHYDNNGNFYFYFILFLIPI